LAFFPCHRLEQSYPCIEGDGPSLEDFLGGTET
jgi:hypothetical protein